MTCSEAEESVQVMPSVCRARNPYRAGVVVHPSQRRRPPEMRDRTFLARGPSSRSVC